MRFKGTPGPWEIDMHENIVHGIADDWGRKRTLCVTGVALAGGVKPEHAANAKLIAAAPELLEALQAVMAHLVSEEVDMTEEEENAHNMARAAIAKALGK